MAPFLALVLGCYAGASAPVGVAEGPAVEVGPRQGRWFEVRVPAGLSDRGDLVVTRSDPAVAVHAVDGRGRLLPPGEEAEGQTAFAVDLHERLHVGLAADTPATVTWGVQLWTDDRVPVEGLEIVEVATK